MSDAQYAAALADAIEGSEDVCLGPTDVALVLKALRALALSAVAATPDPEAA